MLSENLYIVNELGLHARAASKFVSAAKAFGSKVELAFGAQTVDGKSIMSVMLLAAPMGSEVSLIVEGDDEERALAELSALIASGFGEGSVWTPN